MQSYPFLYNSMSPFSRKKCPVVNISASICARCQEATFSRETTERSRRMVHGAGDLFGRGYGVFAYA